MGTQHYLSYPTDGWCGLCTKQIIANPTSDGASPRRFAVVKCRLLAHIKDVHSIEGSEVGWRCRLCSRLFPTYRGIAAHYGSCRKSRICPTAQAETVDDRPSQSDEGSTEIRVPSVSRHLTNVDAATTSSKSDVSKEAEGDQANIKGPPTKRRGERKRAEMAGNHQSPSGSNDTAPAGDIDSTIRVDASTSRPSASEASSASSDGGAEVPAEATQNPGIDGARTEASGPTTGEKEPSGFACEECKRVFGSKAGKQLHRKRVHPVEYNSGLPEPSSRNQFPEEVLADLARAALEWPGRAACGQGVSQFICSRFPAYSVSAINALRKRPHYREMERKMRLETGAAADHAQNPTPTQNSTPAGEVPDEEGSEGSDPSGHEEGSEGSDQRDVDRVVRVARPEGLNPAETKAWDYYDAVCDGGDANALYVDLIDALKATETRGGRSARSSRGSRRRPTSNPEPSRARAGPASSESAPTRTEPKNRSQRKRARYALHQQLYRRNPNALLSELRRPGTQGAGGLPNTDDIARVYGERFGTESPQDNHAFEPKVPGSEAVNLDPFSEDEVRQVLKGLGAASAPGPDGIKVPMLVGWGVNVIRPIVNSFLWTGRIPDQLRVNRTTLIPKKAEPVSLNDYRPITIGQLLNRLYAKLLNRRLMSRVSLNPRQKAFMPVDGCSEHVFVISEAIEQCRKQRKELNLVFLDLAKAFDMVSHSSIIRALCRFGVGQRMAKIVTDLYTNVTTTIRGKQGPTGQIRMARGVKQGCPLSPLLFNMVMDELVDSLGTRHELCLNSERPGFNILAFADDLALASSTEHGLNWLLTRAREFFTDRSMTVNAQKSHAIRLAPSPGTRTVKVVEGSTFSYGEDPIPNRGIVESVKYLGLSLTPTGQEAFSIASAVKDLRLIQGAALKPEQKLDVIRRALLPAQMHVLRLSQRVFVRELSRLDREVRRTVRGILHLPPGTPTAFFYLKSSDGGLTMPDVTHTVGFTRLKRLVSLQSSKDSLVASYARASVSLEREQRYWRAALRIDDTSVVSLRRKKAALPGQRASEYRATTVGRLFESGASREGHAWLTKPKSLRGGDYVLAVKAVSENLPTRMNVTRGRGQGSRACRRCGGPAETQLHALNECVRTKESQIRRHNWVCNSIRDRMLSVGDEQPPTVLTEHRVTVHGEEFRPDLVIVRGHQATVVDVAVCYDNRTDRLRSRYRDKLRKYEVLRDALRQQLNEGRVGISGREVREVTIDAFVIGSRGLMLPETCRRPLVRLGIGSVGFLRLIQEGTVRGSTQVWRAFMAGRNCI